MTSTMCVLGVVVVLTVCLWSSGTCADLPKGAFGLDCLDRYFRMAFDTTFTGSVVRFEVVSSSGVYPITEQYAAECGYSVTLFPHLGLAELRASYFSCHTLNEDDATFTLSFNLIATQDGREETYPLTKTCSPALPWSPREVNCEVNYMELTMQNDVRFPPGTGDAEWTSTLDAAYSLAQNDWQVLFQKGEQQGEPPQQLTPMTLSAAREQGYVIAMTKGRFVFRTPYHQPDSIQTLEAGVAVETVHATLFSRQGWTLLVVDLLAACPSHDGFYNGSSLVWVNPLRTATSDPRSQRLVLGVDGELLEPAVAAERGYDMETFDTVAHIMIPYDAEGGYRKGFVVDNVYREYYVFQLYFEEQFTDENRMDTRHRQYRPLVSPLLSRPTYSVNETVLAERAFTVYFGDFARDVELTGVRLNGVDSLETANASKDVHPNLTHGYTLRVPFDHPTVLAELSEDGILQYTLEINLTLSIVPSMESFHHHVAVMAVFNDVFPPVFDTHCFETGIGFKLDLGPFASLWAVYVGPYPLTEDLALDREYMVTNDSRGLVLNVPVFTDGYTYEKIGAKTFSGTFEVVVRNARTLAVMGTTVQTCPFATSELILCSPKGKVTVVANLSMALPVEGNPYTVSLLDQTCQAKETERPMALFTFGVNTCGTKVKLENNMVVYENQVVVTPSFLPGKGVALDAPERVTVRCVYYLSGLHRLFRFHKFDSDVSGVGSVMHVVVKPPGRPQETLSPDVDASPPPPLSSSGEVASEGLLSSAGEDTRYRPARYAKVVNLLKDLTKKTKDRSRF